MMHLAIAPILIPFAAGIVLVGLRDARPVVQRAVALAATLAGLTAALALTARVADGSVLVYRLGDWPARFGIALMVDRLNATLVVLMNVIALAALISACDGHDQAGSRDFHALFQWQMLGIAGAFLTGDAFNLFVFFEILLISSYALLLHGAGPERVRAALPYVVLNLIGSAAFLIAVGILYGVAGALNMADLGVALGTLEPDDRGLALAGARLLLVVFALKAALLPLGLWLPQVYRAASGPVAALFAILTKVGIYAVIRAESLMFSGPALEGQTTLGLLGLGTFTLVVAAAGVLAARRLGTLAGFAVLSSVGLLLVVVATGSDAGVAVALFYTIHSTPAAALLFLLADAIALGRGSAGDRLDAGTRPEPWAWLAAAFFAAVVAAAGLPPLMGFAAKLLVLDAVRAATPNWPWIWTAVLATSLATLVGFARAFSAVFWRSDTAAVPEPAAAFGTGPRATGVALLLAGLLAITVAAKPLYAWCAQTAAALDDVYRYRLAAGIVERKP